MCGIFGVVDLAGKPLDPGLGRAMGDRLHHRGPDDRGVSNRDGVLLGNCRLSIIDLAGGHQPFVSADGRISVVQNGEIFNYLELAEDLAGRGFPCKTQSDTEVLLRLYEAEGPSFVRHLNGMFAVALHDAARREVWLYRDRVGVKPLYYHEGNGRLTFASEIKALLAAGVPRELDPEALHHYLTFNYVPPPYTLFKGIRHVPPGHRMRISPEGVELSRWWDLSAVHAEERPEAEWKSMFLDTLTDAIRLRLRSDVPFGAFLSGGVDSGSVVGLMAGQLRDPVKTFSIGFHDPRFDESMHAEAVARAFRTSHVMEKVDANMVGLWPLATYHCDQPHGDTSFMPTYRLSQLAAKQVKVVLTGDGGDELFAGYEKYADFFSARADFSDEEQFERAYFGHISLLDGEAKRNLYGADLNAEVGSLDSFECAAPLFRSVRHMDRINRALFLDTMLLLSGNNVVKPDRMGMAVSIEARTPFLDYRMLDLAFRMPGNLKLKGKETKYLYKQAVEGLLGKALVHRPKQMFTVPVGEWFKGPLSGFLREVLSSPRATARRLFLPGRVDALMDEHRTGKANHTRILRALVALELWHRMFIDEFVSRAPSWGDLGLPEPSGVLS